MGSGDGDGIVTGSFRSLFSDTLSERGLLSLVDEFELDDISEKCSTITYDHGLYTWIQSYKP